MGMKRQLSGNIAAVAAYVLWGALPLYWGLLDAVSPFVVLSFRVLTSLLLLSPILLFARWRGEIRRVLSNRAAALKALAASLLIFFNWGLFIWGLSQGMHIDVSFGYYFSPLLQVMLGAVFFRERMGPVTVAAFALALGAVVYMMIAGGFFPWFSVALAATFSVYGLVKKKVDTDAYSGLLLETMFSAPLAAAILVVYGAGSSIPFGQEWGTSLLLIGSGVVTMAPLALYSAAAQRIPLTSLGFFQYFSPTITLLIGVYVYGKSLTSAEMVGFVVIWIALAVYSAGAVYRMRRNRAAAERTKEAALSSADSH